jgi:hypothetical protein
MLLGKLSKEYLTNLLYLKVLVITVFLGRGDCDNEKLKIYFLGS